MSRLSKCLTKAAGLFTKKEEALLYEIEGKNKAKGDVEAATIAVFELHSKLNDELNDLKSKAGIKEEIVKPVKQPEKISINEADKENFLSDDYTESDLKKAENLANEISNSTTKEALGKLKEIGLFASVGQILDWRVDLGLSTKEFNATLKQIQNDKETVTSKKLLDFVDGIKETGMVPMIGHTGGMSEKHNMPLYYFTLGQASQRELSQQEINEELEKESAREQVFAETGQFQKKSKFKGDVQKVLDRIQKSMPKVNVVMDENLDAAGKVQGNTLTINPYFAGTDTPIHEAGHILIDAIGFKNKVIQSAIAQLKTTELWNEVKSNEFYKDLSEENLAKEVLAEAIGREGANIFDKEADKSKFKTFLDYIFTRLKQLLGIDKNIAKSLAKQIIGGIGTKELVGTTEEAQFSKKELSDYDKGVKKLADEVMADEDISSVPYEDLLELYNAVEFMDSSTEKKIYSKKIKTRIAMNIHDRQVMEIKADPKLNKTFNEIEASKKDINAFTDVKFKALSHFTSAFPTMQFLSKEWDSRWFTKTKEARREKTIHEKLALDVIKEKRKQLGLSAVAKDLLVTDNAKYFDFIENKGKILTIEEAKKKGLSQAQMKYLEYVRETIAERQKLTEDEDKYNMDMDILKIDKGFYEAFKTEGLTKAFGNWLGNTYNMNNVRISFVNPLNGKTEISEYRNIEKAIVEYGQKGNVEAAKSLLLLAKYNMKARRQLKKKANVDETKTENILKIVKGGDYTLDENGQLRSKFSRKRDESRSYSQDFYKAMTEYIDDSMHIKHISPLVPIINSIEYLNDNGAYDAEKTQIHGKKENVAKWIREWENLHVLKKPDENLAEFDLALRFLRFFTSATTMLFNVPANIMNLAIGNYNNWRAENSQVWVKGQARLFGKGKRELSSEGGYLTLNKYAADIVRKYTAVSTDVDSNPLRTAKNIFTKLGYLGQSFGEFQIQGSGMLGLMSEDDYNSFEYKKNKFGVDELVVKEGVDEKALEARILKLINRVSDVQGKYSEKDRRNIMNNELGQAVMQFKTWVVDWYRIRYGEEGSWPTMFRNGFEELRNDIREKGKVKAFWENKAFMSNLKGALFTAFLMTLVYRDDEDKKKSDAARMLERGLSDVLFIFDPNNLKFTITRPIASVSKIEQFIDLYAHAVSLEGDKLGKDVAKMIPGRKVVDVVDYLTEEE